MWIHVLVTGSASGHHDMETLSTLLAPGQMAENDIFRCIFVNEKFSILIKISLKIVPKGPIDNIQALVQIMAWRQIGDKPLFESVLTWFTDAYMRH